MYLVNWVQQNTRNLHMETIQKTRNIISPLTFQCFSNITVRKPNSMRSDRWTVILVYDLPHSSVFPNILQSLQLTYLLHKALELWVASHVWHFSAQIWMDCNLFTPAYRDTPQFYEHLLQCFFNIPTDAHNIYTLKSTKIHIKNT